MAERRQLELDIRPEGNKTNVKVDGQAFLVDHLNLVSDLSSTDTMVVAELRHLTLNERHRIIGILQPDYVGPVGGAKGDKAYESIDIDIEMGGSAHTTNVAVNGEAFRDAYRVMVTASCGAMTYVEVYYSNAAYKYEHWLMSGYLLPQKDAD